MGAPACGAICATHHFCGEKVWTRTVSLCGRCDGAPRSGDTPVLMGDEDGRRELGLVRATEDD